MVKALKISDTFLMNFNKLVTQNSSAKFTCFLWLWTIPFDILVMQKRIEHHAFLAFDFTFDPDRRGGQVYPSRLPVDSTRRISRAFMLQTYVKIIRLKQLLKPYDGI